MNKIFTLLSLLAFSFGFAQSPWPSVNWNSADNLTDIIDTDGLTDMSGLHWNPVTERLYCIQGDGRLYVLQQNSTATGYTIIANKSVPDGPEGITQVSFTANEFYTIDENNYEIRKFTHNAAFGNLVESRHWDLLASPSPMEDTGNNGPEGIVFIPDSALSASAFVSQQTGLAYTSTKGMGGLMFVAHQDEGYIWVFDINPNVTNDFAYVGKYKTNRLESTDLAFDRTTGLLYILHNIDANYIEVTDLSSVITTGSTRKFVTKSEYFVANPTDDNVNIEGFAIAPKCPGGNGVSAWLCRDVEGNEDDEIQQDALRWFNPYVADGVCTPLSVDENFTSQIAVYPNPGNGIVTISLGNFSTGTNIRIINSLGQTVMKIKSETGNPTFDASSLASGMYLIEINQGQNTATVKWIRN